MQTNELKIYKRAVALEFIKYVFVGGLAFLVPEIQARISEADICEIVIFYRCANVFLPFNVIPAGDIDDKCFFEIF